MVCELIVSIDAEGNEHHHKKMHIVNNKRFALLFQQH